MFTNNIGHKNHYPLLGFLFSRISLSASKSLNPKQANPIQPSVVLGEGGAGVVVGGGGVSVDNDTMLMEI